MAGEDAGSRRKPCVEEAEMGAMWSQAKDVPTFQKLEDTGKDPPDPQGHKGNKALQIA